jgi:hypothetical protein
MASFLSRLILERAIGRDEWTLAAPLIYLSDRIGVVHVPEGFVTDFASIPRALHRLLPKNGEYDAPALVHDWLYATAPCDRATADDVFLEAMESLNVPWWKRASMYRAVRLFGWAAWNAHRRRTAALLDTNEIVR